jgi:hypothetical protein
VPFGAAVAACVLPVAAVAALFAAVFAVRRLRGVVDDGENLLEVKSDHSALTALPAADSCTQTCPK